VSSPEKGDALPGVSERVAAGPYHLSLGDRGGTRLELAGTVEEHRARGIAEALTAPIQNAVDKVGGATDDVDRAITLIKAAAAGGLADEDVINTEIDVVLRALSKFDSENRFEQELELARTLANLLVLIEHWIELLRMLRGLLGSKSRALEAWARHELGTLSACAGRTRDATRYLASARRIRSEIGDRSGLATTNQNLALTNAQVGWVPGQRRRWSPRRGCAMGALAAVLAGVGIGAVADNHVHHRRADAPILTLAGPTTQRTTLMFHGHANTGAGYRQIVDVRIYSDADPSSGVVIPTSTVPVVNGGRFHLKLPDTLKAAKYFATASQSWGDGAVHLQSSDFAFSVVGRTTSTQTPPKRGFITIDHPSAGNDLESPLIIGGRDQVAGGVGTPDVVIFVYPGASTTSEPLTTTKPVAPDANGSWTASIDTGLLESGSQYTLVARQSDPTGETFGESSGDVIVTWIGNPDRGSGSISSVPPGT